MSRSRVWRWLPALLIMTVIAWLSHQPEWPAPVRGYPDWLLHGLAYGGLGAACLFATVAELPGLVAPAIAALAITVAYGIVDEIHQAFVPGRESAAHDVLADAVGASIALALLTFARLWGVWEDPSHVRRRPRT